jgi:coenzyme F420-reducing hydrogenase beta subunit
VYLGKSLSHSQKCASTENVIRKLTYTVTANNPSTVNIKRMCEQKLWTGDVVTLHLDNYSFRLELKCGESATFSKRDIPILHHQKTS